jgi:Ubiquitin carboxyl-terminal hydrolase
MYEYDLFAVINHEGQMNNGHYTNYARYCDEVCEITWLEKYSRCCSGIDLTTTSAFDHMLLLKHILTLFQSPSIHFARLPKFGSVHVLLRETAPRL